MANIRAKVNAQKDLRIKSSVGANQVNKLDDIDVTNLSDGSVLVYSQSSSKWEATTVLEKQQVECGQY
jgi:hypothetical protein